MEWRGIQLVGIRYVETKINRATEIKAKACRTLNIKLLQIPFREHDEDF